jgi:hypothetical protein
MDGEKFVPIISKISKSAHNHNISIHWLRKYCVCAVDVSCVKSLCFFFSFLSCFFVSICLSNDMFDCDFNFDIWLCSNVIVICGMWHEEIIMELWRKAEIFWKKWKWTLHCPTNFDESRVSKDCSSIFHRFRVGDHCFILRISLISQKCHSIKFRVQKQQMSMSKSNFMNFSKKTFLSQTEETVIERWRFWNTFEISSETFSCWTV